MAPARAAPPEERQVLKIGKKAGTYFVATVLASYDLDVYVDVESGTFSILIPTAPGARVEPRRRDSFELSRGRDLDELKKVVREHLISRDVTDFHDIIECYVDYDDDEDNAVRFDFEVARVSTAVNGQGDPKLEMSIILSEAGEITETLLGGDHPPRAYREKRLVSRLIRIPFTVERWHKCVAIRDGIRTLRSAMENLFGGPDVAAKLDLAGKQQLLLLQGETEK